LSLDKCEPGFYTAEHASRLERLAGHASLALLNAQTYGEVEKASVTDFLTGAYNHRYFQQQLRLELDKAVQKQTPLALLMIDIDFFKKVNDTYGHMCGDQVLRALAERLHARLRGMDFLARYGGEEFAVLLPKTSAALIGQVAERLRHAVVDTPFETECATFPVTISVGAAAYPDHAQDAQALVAAADAALYQAKGGGRNRVCLAGS
jgi:diguanylate cyclase (GGDEF)-like protein